jgi:UDP-N-acetylmuramoyl-L-alanyl-D-glutamate--2,6-diaminopimelate ligase
MSQKIFVQKIKNITKHLPNAIFWNIVNKFPARKMKIIAVTGTDGKTTTANMIYHIFKQISPDSKVGLVSTISAKIGGKDLDTGFHVTSPTPRNIQKYLSMMLEQGVEWVVLETTSHALDQFRYWGIQFDIAVYTNVTHEHIDYHQSYSNYLKAKLKLIDNLKKEGTVICNFDDESFSAIFKHTKKRYSDEYESKLIVYGENIVEEPLLKNIVQLSASDIVCGTSSIDYSLKNSSTKSSNYMVSIPMVGRYNIYNSLAATSAVMKALPTAKVQNIVNALKSFNSLEGRMQTLQEGNKNRPTVIVDFAHTPNALQNALSSLKSITEKSGGKLIVVFGCAGLRDVAKRSMMGKIAAEYADTVILVPEDPRTEDLKLINDAIVRGIKNYDMSQEYYRFDEANIESRKKGITKALELAKPNDVVIITGKGHEKTLCFGKTEFEYSDQQTVRDLLGI